MLYELMTLKKAFEAAVSFSLQEGAEIGKLCGLTLASRVVRSLLERNVHNILCSITPEALHPETSVKCHLSTEACHRLL